jgi:hypothetical protein
MVNREMTFAERWTHPEDQIAEWRHKAAMCAEVLVPDCVPAAFVRGAYTLDVTVQERVNALGLSINAVPNARLFFR